MKYHPKHVEHLTDLNKPYSVVSCGIITAILYDARSIEHKILSIYSCTSVHRIKASIIVMDNLQVSREVGTRASKTSDIKFIL